MSQAQNPGLKSTAHPPGYQAQFSRSCPQPQGRGSLHRKAVDDLVVAVLGVGEGDAGVDLQGLAVGVAAVGLDKGVVDPLGLELQ